MNHLGVAPYAHGASAFLATASTSERSGQDLRDQFLKSGFTGNRNEMAQQGRANPLPLVRVDNGEGDLGLARLHEDIAAAADDRGPAVFIDHRDQGHVVSELDVTKKSVSFSENPRRTAKKRR